MFLRKNKKYQYNKSLDDFISVDQDGNELKIGDTLYDDSSDFVLDYEKAFTYKILREVVEELQGREKEIIKLKFGFYDDKIYTQEEIAEKFNITQSGVSRLVKKIVNEIGEKLLDYGVIDVVGKEKTKNKGVSRKLKSLYEYFKDYSKEQIHLVISILSNDDKKLISLRYGSDLENPVTSEKLREEDNLRFYQYLVPKMKRLLLNLDNTEILKEMAEKDSVREEDIKFLEMNNMRQDK